MLRSQFYVVCSVGVSNVPTVLLSLGLLQLVAGFTVSLILQHIRRYHIIGILINNMYSVAAWRFFFVILWSSLSKMYVPRLMHIEIRIIILCQNNRFYIVLSYRPNFVTKLQLFRIGTYLTFSRRHTGYDILYYNKCVIIIKTDIKTWPTRVGRCFVFIIASVVFQWLGWRFIRVC